MSKLEKATHISIIGVAVVALVCMFPALKRTVWPSPHESQAARMVGQKLSLPELESQVGRAQVIIAMTSQCPFCINSLPLYQEISSSIANTGGTSDLVVASLTPDIEGVKSLLDSHGIKAAKIVRSRGADLKVTGTPTVYLVDRGGIVRWAYLGEMTRTKERELLAALAKLSS